MKPLPLILIAGGVLVSALALAADAKFTAADQDGNGVLTMAEVFVAMPDATPDQFQTADKNQDGALTEEEYMVAVNEGVLPEG
ncbi:MAG: EF-hand domain-containing protein [Pseudomonadota bacterium]